MNNNKNNTKDKDVKVIKTTGHSWDGIEEYNTPAPRWWLIVWLVTIIWSIIYWFFFPSWPTINGNLSGIGNWSSKSELIKEEKEISARKDLYLQEFRDATFEEILNDSKLSKFALNGGRIAFKENCAACHGTGADGSKGFPNLNDDDWLWGGGLGDIYQTIRYGIRSSHLKARVSEMPAFGSGEILDRSQIKIVAKYVESLAGFGNASSDGKRLFDENCAVCHKSTGVGDRSMGAPNLTDSIWLYGGDSNDIEKTIYYSRKGVMPNWDQRLNDDIIRQLTIYIHSLGGGE